MAGIASKTIVTFAALSMTVLATAQNQRNLPSLPAVESFAMYPSNDPARLRMMTILQSGLNSSSLNLSTAQKASIDRILDGFVAELVTINRAHPAERGKRMSATEMGSRQTAATRFNASVVAVMNSEQRKVYEADRAARRTALERRLSNPAQEKSR